jgi:hypothetical protein
MLKIRIDDNRRRELEEIFRRHDAFPDNEQRDEVRKAILLGVDNSVANRTENRFASLS